jgi:hypothetical protein
VIRLPEMSSCSADEDQRQRRRLAHAKVLRLRRQQFGIRGHEFGKRTLDTADATRHSIDFITWLERRNASSNALDRTGNVNAEDGRR